MPGLQRRDNARVDAVIYKATTCQAKKQMCFLDAGHGTVQGLGQCLRIRIKPACNGGRTNILQIRALLSQRVKKDARIDFTHINRLRPRFKKPRYWGRWFFLIFLSHCNTLSNCDFRADCLNIRTSYQPSLKIYILQGLSCPFPS